MLINLFRNNGASAQQKFLIFVASLLAVLTILVLGSIAEVIISKANGDDNAANLGYLSLNPLKHISVFGIIMLLFVGFAIHKEKPRDPSRYKNRNIGLFTVSFAHILSNLILSLISYIALVCLGAIVKHEIYNNFLIILVNFIFYYFLVLGTVSLFLTIFSFIPACLCGESTNMVKARLYVSLGILIIFVISSMLSSGGIVGLIFNVFNTLFAKPAIHITDFALM